MYSQIHIKNYEKIISGKYMPCGRSFNDPKHLCSILKEANTHLLASIPEDQDPKEIIQNTDHQILGFKHPDHFKIECYPGKISDKKDIYIKPTKFYDLNDFIDIPQYVSVKANCFIEFITDEYARIIIRANRMLEIIRENEQLNHYACKNIQKVKQLLDNARHLLRSYQEKKDVECIYIAFVLCIYLIKTLVFYQKTFQLFTKIITEDEDQLRNDLNSWLLKGNTDFIMGLNFAGCFQTRSSKTIVAYGLKKNRFKRASSDHEVFFDNEQSGEDKEQAPMKGRWRGQINVLVDVFTQLSEEYEIDGKPILDAPPQVLQDIILRSFTDKDGHDLSPHTINTLLKPYRTDKRLHPDSPKRIDLSDIIE